MFIIHNISRGCYPYVSPYAFLKYEVIRRFCGIRSHILDMFFSDVAANGTRKPVVHFVFIHDSSASIFFELPAGNDLLIV